MVQNILAIIIVLLAAVISIYSVVRSLTSKKGAHCDGCSACGTSSSGRSKTKTLPNIDFKHLVLDHKGK